MAVRLVTFLSTRPLAPPSLFISGELKLYVWIGVHGAPAQPDAEGAEGLLKVPGEGHRRVGVQAAGHRAHRAHAVRPGTRGTGEAA